MIKLIVGLGNPGQEYEKTRHNAGFLFLDYLYSGSWLNEPRFHGKTATLNIGNESIRLLKPMTFMNRSGLATYHMARYYKINPDEILVIHDELDFNVGEIKLKKGGGHAGHNGLRDIITHLHDNTFYRLRIGIARPSSSHQIANYVLSVPNKAERESLMNAFSEANACLEQILLGDIVKAMNVLNAKK